MPVTSNLTGEHPGLIVGVRTPLFLGTPKLDTEGGFRACACSGIVFYWLAVTCTSCCTVNIFYMFMGISMAVLFTVAIVL